MEIILREDITNLGKAGEVVSVREGYARNFLLPRKKAVVADGENMKSLEHEKRVIASKQQKMKKGALELAEKISALSITIGREAGEEDKLWMQPLRYVGAAQVRQAGALRGKSASQAAQRSSAGRWPGSRHR